MKPGRRGTWFACEHCGILPDLITGAAGIACGRMPLALAAGGRVRAARIGATAEVGG
ncbi:MAG TPA: hypothetical protein VMF55_09485 [Solirubrobacterales bacterium]|nr:hypothetical protein [Solirubrobacterales bacterium]